MRPQVLFPLFAPITSLRGVGPKLAPLLEKVAGPQVRDLAFLAPTGVIDRPVLRIAEAVEGQVATFVVTVDAHQPGAGRTPYRMRVADETGFLHLIWFGHRGPSLAQAHPLGAVRAVSGKLESFGSERQITHPDHMVAPERAGDIPRHEAVYPATAGLTSRMIATRVHEAVERAPELPEWQDAAFLARRGWSGWRAALDALHAPQGEADLLAAAPARARLAYDELLAHQLAMASRKRARRTEPGAVIPGGELSRRIEAALPFRLTGAQRRTLAEIGGDLASGERMTRLVQGDVGSGKTAVAMLAMADAAESGRQSALMAPTEILARQHFETISGPLEAAGVRVVLLTGRDKGAVRADKLMALAAGEAAVAVGTHALFQDEVRFRSLALAVVDEQHRFGVNERRRLQEKGEGVHLLALSATPIPRTLELTLFGDLDVSKLDEKPAGRRPVTTTLSPSTRVPELVERLRAAIDGGAQAFWICPLVAENEELTATAAEVRAAALREALGAERVGLAHGQLPSVEKDAVMAAFADGRVSVLVATTVVEVGVNVPNATIMVVEHAERFGLAQLHQLRGRVGRGSQQSACVLLYDPPLSEAGRKRLEVLRETEDGFVIAQRDLDLRGGGDLLGSRQSGLPAYRFADPLSQRELVEAAAKDAQLVLARDPELIGERAQALVYLRELFDWRWEDGEWSAAG